MWEEYRMYEDPWPTLGKTFELKNAQIFTDHWAYLDATNSSYQYTDLSHYDRSCVSQYYHWLFRD
jgi:hypothetical protein